MNFLDPIVPDDSALIRAWVIEGRSDEEIAQKLHISVKLVRPVRCDVEAEVRPRVVLPRDLF